ncbi:unnamed protein product [Hyaloperonospora brassicae]|uniref:TNase-like domain-containing protein n=1 Tax=Hyaloperonospora brassicae TaxID=162125 RepID=A0AAV0TYG2_HYABA|nr:unnamed protein product [Hyaloperonospora brassicae]
MPYSPGPTTQETDLTDGSSDTCDPSIASTCHGTPSTHTDGINDHSIINNHSGWRQPVGRFVARTQQTIDSHLALFRTGLFVAIATSVAVSLHLSGLFSRFKRVEDIPLWHFARRKKLRVRMIAQSQSDPNVLYVCHVPFVRCTMLRDAAGDPSSVLQMAIAKKQQTKQQRSDLIAVRPFGVRVDKRSNEWIDATLVASHRYLTIQLLQRRSHVESSEYGSVAVCNIAQRRFPLRQDVAQELVARGYAECIPEHLEHYDNGSSGNVADLTKRLRNLKAAQKRAQVMQYGIWTDWRQDKLTDRVVSTAKRTALKGLQKVVDRIRY